MSVNISKCTVQNIAPHNLVVRDGKSLADRVKTLGVVLDHGLTFSDHISQVTQRAIGSFKGLRRFRILLPETAKPRLMKTLVLSVLYYCLPVYRKSISREDVGRIRRMQNSDTWLIFNLRQLTMCFLCGMLSSYSP
ncbi:hypothetical protein J6590_018981 [Homalodisca vitripennis]|nr:hypothetical protein J6590_018981 [Homalodisca vitripennis]